jgi:hypothetical protein
MMRLLALGVTNPSTLDRWAICGSSDDSLFITCCTADPAIIGPPARQSPKHQENQDMTQGRLIRQRHAQPQFVVEPPVSLDAGNYRTTSHDTRTSHPPIQSICPLAATVDNPSWL